MLKYWPIMWLVEKYLINIKYLQLKKKLLKYTSVFRECFESKYII